MTRPSTSAPAAVLNDRRAAPKTLMVNGEHRILAAATLDLALDELGYGSAPVATALNGKFVPAMRRAETLISADDHIEIVAPRAGG